MPRFAIVVMALAASALALPRASFAQTRVSVGLGGGIAGSTESSLSEGRSAPIVMGQVAAAVAPFVAIGAEVNYWRRRVSSITFATGEVQLHAPATPLRLTLGAGYGRGDPDGNGTISGVAGQLGAAYDVTVPVAPVAVTLFVNALVAHASLRSAQMVDGGLAITWR